MPRGSPPVERECKQCHGLFRVYASHLPEKMESYGIKGAGTFCSRECYAQWQRENLGGPSHPQYKRIKRVCKICSTAFFIPPKQLKQLGGGSFCSKKCFAEARRQKLLDDNPSLKPEVQAKLRDMWADPEFKERTLRAQLKGLFKRPTSLERQFINLIRQEALPYKYTGDGSFLIGFKNPDFVNINGAKICIEVGHNYFHPDPWAEKRRAHFAKYGWECLIFMVSGNKLNEPEVLSVLKGEAKV